MEEEKNNKHQNRARMGTSIFVLLMLIFLFFFGLTYIDPAPVGGIPISFGYDNAGSGDTEAAPKPTQTKPTPEQPVEATQDIATQDLIEAPAINTEKPTKKPIEKPKDPVKETPKDPVKEDPKPDKNLANALTAVSNQEEVSENPSKGTGEGDERDGGGDHGDPNGDKNSKSRVGFGGNGNGYFLGNGRGARNTPPPEKGCQKEGTIVMRVEVSPQGKTLTASVINDYKSPNGKVYRTNTFDTCLVAKSKRAAKATSWDPDSKEIDNKAGFIIYTFTF